MAVALAAAVVVPSGSAVVNANCNVTQARSIDGTTPSQITFVNESGTEVDIYWLDYEGARVHYATLPDGAGYSQPTWLTHPWVAVDKAGNCLGYVLSEALEQSYTILPLELPGNGRIFFLRSTSLPDQNHDIYSVRPVGSGLQGVVTDPSADQLVAVSPDGSRSVFASKDVAAPADAFELYLDGPGGRDAAHGQRALRPCTGLVARRALDRLRQQPRRRQRDLRHGPPLADGHHGLPGPAPGQRADVLAGR